MGNLKNIDFERCTSGIEFEGWVCDLLRKLSFTADRVGKNDSGVDIIMRAKWNDKVYRFYIQCNGDGDVLRFSAPGNAAQAAQQSL